MSRAPHNSARDTRVPTRGGMSIIMKKDFGKARRFERNVVGAG